MRKLLTALLATLALAAPLAPAGAQAPLEIEPGKLARGADLATPHLEGTTIVDGDRRVSVKAGRIELHGRWKGFYVASLGDRSWAHVRLVRISKAGVVKTLRQLTDPFNTILDPVAGQVAYSFGDSTRRPTIAVYDLAAKAETSARAFASLPTLLEYDEGLVVASLGGPQVRTLTWDTISDDVLVLNQKQGWFASKAHDLYSYFTKDPFLGGCTVLARLSDPTERLWTSCDERIEAVSPDGRKMATVALLADGIGPNVVLVRKTDGRRLALYSIAGYFGRIDFETPQALLLDSFGRTQHAVVRCVVTVCDRATDLEPTPPLRTLALGR